MKARKVRLSEWALRDLETIGDRIAIDSPMRARTFLKEIRQSCASLDEFPERFERIRRYSDLRRRVHGNYLIFFDLTDAYVDVVRILHGAMDYERILFQEDDLPN